MIEKLLADTKRAIYLARHRDQIQWAEATWDAGQVYADTDAELEAEASAALTVFQKAHTPVAIVDGRILASTRLIPGQAALRDAEDPGNNRPRTGSGIPPAPTISGLTGNRAGNSAAETEAGATRWTASKLLEDLSEAIKRAEYFQTGEGGLLRRTTITIQNLLHHGQLEAEVRLIIRDLDTARAAGTVITYGHIQRRLQEALERSES